MDAPIVMKSYKYPGNAPDGPSVMTCQITRQPGYRYPWAVVYQLGANEPTRRVDGYASWAGAFNAAARLMLAASILGPAAVITDLGREADSEMMEELLGRHFPHEEESQ